ncbi:hypothetical protein CNECB9_1560012 [Cupriavidus necator]|uniref:Uncharacterized protein n=2 Tax=Cupriavidus necator TaxID=106590 RepID=A0A1K0IA28_CUPNE|nr:hypothetical protein CNECB9_1560012 [Cupriavidus necator]
MPKINQYGGKIAGQDAGISVPSGSQMEITQHGGEITGHRAIEERDSPAVEAIAARLSGAPHDEIREAVTVLRAMRGAPMEELEATVRTSRLGKWLAVAGDVAPEVVGFIIKTALAAAG